MQPPPLTTTGYPNKGKLSRAVWAAMHAILRDGRWHLRHDLVWHGTAAGASPSFCEKILKDAVRYGALVRFGARYPGQTNETPAYRLAPPGSDAQLRAQLAAVPATEARGWGGKHMLLVINDRETVSSQNELYRCMRAAGLYAAESEYKEVIDRLIELGTVTAAPGRRGATTLAITPLGRQQVRLLLASKKRAPKKTY